MQSFRLWGRCHYSVRSTSAVGRYLTTLGELEAQQRQPGIQKAARSEIGRRALHAILELQDAENKWASRISRNDVKRTLRLIVQDTGSPDLALDVTNLLKRCRTDGIELSADEFYYLLRAHASSSPHRAAAVFDKLYAGGVKLNVKCYGALILGFAKVRDSLNSVSWYNRMLRDGHSADAVTLDAVVECLSWNGDLKSARDLLSSTRNVVPTIHTFKTLIRGNCLVGHISDACKIFNEMIAYGVKPDIKIFTYLLAGFRDAQDLAGCDLVHEKLNYFGLQPDLKFWSLLINAHARARDRDGACRLFDILRSTSLQPDIVVWNQVLLSHCVIGDLAKAESVISNIFACGIDPDEASFTILIDAFMRHGNSRDAERWHQELVAYAAAGKIVHQGKWQLPLGVAPATAMVTGYARKGEMSLARRWFEKSSDLNIRAYTALARAAAIANDPALASSWLADAQRSGISLDRFAWSSVAIGSSIAGNLAAAREALSNCRMLDLQPTDSALSAIVRAHITAKDLITAIEIVNSVSSPKLPIYVPIICTLGHHRLKAQSREPICSPPSLVSKDLPLEPFHSDAPYHWDLLRLYDKLRNQPADAKRLIPLSVYDALIAHYVNFRDLVSARKVFQHMLLDGVSPDISVIARLAKAIGRVYGWAAVYEWCSRTMDEVRTLALALDPPLDARSRGPNFPELNEWRSTRLRIAKPVATVQDIESLLLLALLALYPRYAFRRSWTEAFRGNQDTVEGTHLNEASFIAFDNFHRLYVIRGPLTSEEGTLRLWGVATRVQSIFRDPVHAAYEDSNINFGISSLESPSQAQKAIPPGFHTLSQIADHGFSIFCFAFVRWCELNYFWEAKSSALRDLASSSLHWDDTLYVSWLRTMKFGRFRIPRR